MTTLQPKTKAAVLQIARWQVGVLESPAGSNKVKFNTDFYGKAVSGSAYPWCMAFVWWVFREAGFSLYKTASCSALLNQYRKVSPHQIVKDGYRAGDIVLFDFSGKRTKTEHVGIVLESSADGKTLITVEGNTGTTNDANGGAVMIRERSAKLVTCAIRPGYPD